MSEEIGGNPRIPVDRTEQIIGVENDQYGHVNYKDYPKLFEPGQDAYVAARGFTFDGIEKEFGLRSVVPSYTVDVKAESLKGDRVQVETRIDRVGNTSFTYGQSMTRENTLIAKFTMVVVLIDSEGKPVGIPDKLREKLQAPVETK